MTWSRTGWRPRPIFATSRSPTSCGCLAARTPAFSLAAASTRRLKRCCARPLRRRGRPPNNGANAIRSCMAFTAQQADFAALSRTAVPALAPVRFEGSGQRGSETLCSTGGAERRSPCKYRRGDGGMGKLEGKVALVTGSGRNIGRATVLRLSGEGAHVVVNARSNQQEAETVAREARDLGVKAVPILADIGKKAEVEALAARALSEFGRVETALVGLRPREPCRIACSISSKV